MSDQPGRKSIDAAVTRERARVEADRVKFRAKPKPVPATKSPVTIAGLEKSTAGKANVRIIEGPGAQPDVPPRDTFSDKIGFGFRKEAAPARVVFRNTTAKSADANSRDEPRDPFSLEARLGMSARKQEAPRQAIGYVRASAPETEAIKQRFRQAAATELRWEAVRGRGVLRGIIHGLGANDTIILEKVADLALPTELGRVVKQVQDKGAHVVALDGSADTRTEAGRAAIAKIVSTLGLFGPRA